MNEHADTVSASHSARSEGEVSHSLATHDANEAAQGEHQGSAGKIDASQLLKHIQDSREIEFPGGHVELPYILFDRDGFHAYGNAEHLTESGVYTLQHNETPIRTADGNPPLVDLSITKHVVFLWLAAFVLCIVAISAARKNAKRIVATGLGNLMETFVVFMRDEIVIPNMGPGGIRYLPYLLTTFFFILLMNIFGLIPYGASATANINVTGGLAIIAFFMIQVSAIRAQGLKHYLAHLTGGVHWSLWWLMIPIEILGLFTKPFALCIRLFANMVGGHMVIVALLALIFVFGSYFVAVAPVAFAVAIMFLEIFVAFLQAYVFTMLTSLFMGLGMQEASHEEHGGATAG
jgi:F-type H+-transporting ATPase subunit a